MDETSLYHYDPESKQQSMEWQHSSSPCHNKFQVLKPIGKIVASIFWDQNGILLIDYFPKGQTINAEYYSPLLVLLEDISKGKTTWQGQQQGLVLAKLCTGSSRTCNREATGLPGPPMT
jgi:hypothetical protein